MLLMTSFKILVLQLISLTIFGQDSIKGIQFSQIDWKLSVPLNANIHSSIRQDTIKQIASNYVKERVIIEKDKYNTCSIKVKPSEPDSLKAMPDAEAWEQSKKIIALTYTQRDSETKFLDSVSSFEVIDGVQFDIFFYKIKPANYSIFNVYIFHAKYDLHDINIDFSYDDSNLDLGKQFLEIIRSSKFDRNSKLVHDKN
jgi:hypothetical protein